MAFVSFSLSERARLLKNVRNVFTFRSENSHANVELEMSRKCQTVLLILHCITATPFHFCVLVIINHLFFIHEEF